MSEALDNRGCRKAIAALRSRVAGGRDDAFEIRLRRELALVAGVAECAVALRREFGLGKPIRNFERLRRRRKAVQRFVRVLEKNPRLGGLSAPIDTLRAYERGLAERFSTWKVLWPRRAPKREPKPETAALVEVLNFVYDHTHEGCWGPIAILLRHAGLKKSAKSLKSLWNRQR
jgi:hypothetical protein